MLALMTGTALDTWLIFAGRLTLPDWAIFTIALVAGALIALPLVIAHGATLKQRWEK